MWTMICWISNVPYLLELNNVSFWVQWNPFENMFSAMVTIHLHCSLLAFWFLTLNGFFMNSVGIPPNPNPSPPFCMPLWKLATAANSIGASKMGVAQKKMRNKISQGRNQAEEFCIFALSAALLYANKSAAPHHMSPDRGGWTRGIGLLQCAKTYLTLFVMLLDTFILK